MRYRASLVGYCTRLGLSDSRAEDAVQQCFLSALLALRRGDEVRDLRAWLGRIAHNVAVNMMRAGSASRETGTDWTAEDRAIHIPDMDGGLAAREALAEVAALPPMQREALLQSALGGRTYGEVAASMGVSEGAVRGLLHRARATLRNAAAIFSPFPLMRRATTWLGGGSPSAGRVLELSAPGGGTGLSTTAVRTLGAGFTAVVVAAAGVAVAPHEPGHSPGGSSAERSAGSDRHVSAALSSADDAVVIPASGHGVTRSPSGTGISSSSAPSGGTGGGSSSTGEGGTRSLSRHPATSHASPSEGEPQLPSSTSASGPAQVSSVPPASSGTVTTPLAPPSEPVKEVRKPRESPGSDDKSEAEHSKTSELEEEKREREAEEAREKAEIEAGTKPKDN